MVLILVGMAFQERFFCRVLCPMGAVFSMLPVLPLFTLRRDRSECIRGCRACTMKCPSDIELAPDTAPELSGGLLPVSEVYRYLSEREYTYRYPQSEGNEIWFTVLRAVVLLVLFKFIGL